MKKLTAVLIILQSALFAQQNRISTYIEKNYKTETEQTILFKEVEDPMIIEKYSVGVKKCKIVEVDMAQLSHLVKNKMQSLNLQIPFPDNTNHHLKLVSNGFNNHFFDINTSSKDKIETPNAVCYRGIIDNDKNSLAAISFFDNDVIGVLSNTTDGNLNIGKIKGESNLYVIYFEKDLLKKSNFSCGVIEGLSLPNNFNDIVSNINNPKTPQLASTKCIRIYLETSFTVYQNKGNSAPNVTIYALGMFNVWAAVYQNEGIKLEISELYIWTSSDPFTHTNSNTGLNSFGAIRTVFNGDYAHFLDLSGNNNGGFAWLGPSCGSSVNQAYSDIDVAYEFLPTYSWDINVVTHEFGHNLGSNHTHWCGWPGGPIDGCGPTAKPALLSATPPGYNEGCIGVFPPTTVMGTIMSYCQLTTAGVNLALGFGPLPNAVILNEYNTRPCLGSCICGTISITPTITNASCPGFTDGAISITASGGVTPYVFGLNDLATTQNITGLAAGNYTIIVGDANLCPKVTTVSVGVNHQSPTITVNSNTLCIGSTLTLTPNGAITYSWSTGVSAITLSVAPLVDTEYTVTGTDINGCKASETASVMILPLPIISVTSGTVCPDQGLTIFVGGADTYTWITSDDLTPDDNNPNQAIVTPSTQSTYTVFGSYANGCTNYGTTTIYTSLPPDFSLTTATVCPNASATLIATPISSISSFFWSNGTNAVSSAVSATATTIYTCTANNPIGCSASKTTTLYVYPSPVLSSASGTVCFGKPYTINAGGATSYTWSTGSFSSSIVVTPTTTSSYAFSGTSVNGCVGSAIVTVTVVALPVISVVPKSVCLGKSVVLNAVGASSYMWSNSMSAQSITISPTTNTTYTCVGTAITGCSNTAVTNVTVFPIPIIALTSASICAGETATLIANAANTYSWSTGSHASQIYVVPTVSTTYSCVGLSVNNCEYTSNTFVNVTNVTTPSITQNGSVITSSSPTGNQWYLNGVAIPGATGQTYTFLQSGNYSLIVTGANGCESQAANITLLDTSLEDFDLGNWLTVFPNPTSSSITINYPKELNEIVKLKIFAYNGQLVQEQTLEQTSSRIDLADLANGLYIFDCSINNHRTFIKVVKN